MLDTRCSIFDVSLRSYATILNKLYFFSRFHITWMISNKYVHTYFMYRCVQISSLFSSLTHWGRDIIATISQTTFSNAFSWKEMYEFCLRFRWFFSPNVRSNNIPPLVPIMAWRRSGDKPLSEPMMDSILTHICVTRPQWINAIHCFYAKCAYNT